MPKISFVRVESTLGDTLRKIFIDRLAELTTIVSLINEPQSKIQPEKIETVIKHFQIELKRFKEKELKLYPRLGLSPEEENKFFGSYLSFTADDWNRLKTLKEKIDELKKELFGEESPKEEYDLQVEKERRRHLNKRFNVREGWLPLQ